MTDGPERDAYYARGNDAIWGKGQWVKCYRCPPDADGCPPYHHKDYHQT